MLFEISGKGIVCNVYYIEQNKLDEISALVCPAGPGLKELLTKNSDYIVNVSKGFFADYPYRENWNKLSFSLSSGDTIEHEFFEKKWYEFDPDGEFYCSNHPKDFLFINHDARPKDIQEGQVAIVEYREFENGKVSLEIPCEDKNKIAGMKLICESVDRCGPSGNVDLATTATYGEGIVGGEEYEDAEYAIMGLEIDGNTYELPEAKFDKASLRVYLWNYNDESEEYTFDFFGSKGLVDPWVVELVALDINEIEDNFNNDISTWQRVNTFFNQKDLEWIKNNSSYVVKYQKSHTTLKNLLLKDKSEYKLPEFEKENIKIDTCTLLVMLLAEFGVDGYDPKKMSELDEMDAMFLDLNTLAIGNEKLAKSVQKSFCMHFDVIAEFSEESSFLNQQNPDLSLAYEFVESILDDPDASFNQN
jgi:hypothetical protein